MALEKLTDNVEIHQTLGDAPNSEGMTASDLKAKFDEAAKIIKQFINDRIVPNALDKRGDTMRGVLRLGGNRLVDLPEPEEENDAANKAYVDAGLADKAPAGYGLGQTVLTLVSSLEDLDNLLTTGWYRLHAVGTTLNGVAFNYAIVFVCMNGENGYQEIRPAATNCVLKRFRYNGSFGDWCCDNPPMALGVEYRTTERFAERPVFTRIVQLGVTASGKSSVQWHEDANVSPIRQTARFSAQTLPFFDSVGNCLLEIQLISNSATIYCNSSWVVNSDNPILMQVWYLK